jgi:hypothetical protein
MALKYLTVQDILWVNLQATHRVLHYDFAKLEEGTYYQYAYGPSADLGSQAAQFLLGFPGLKPLESGNAATAFVAFATFVEINGYCLQLDDDEAASWYDNVIKANSPANIKSKITPCMPEVDAHADVVDVRSKVRAVIKRYPKTLKALIAPDCA